LLYNRGKYLAGKTKHTIKYQRNSFWWIEERIKSQELRTKEEKNKSVKSI
jgi:hypothetical protein